tara:strand:- start:17682 stop:18134 length:453 start_codon:yes stop_codon:yes gene_type:complete
MSKIPSYYNNFKKNDEGEPDDMVSWKAWLAASAAALFGMAASAEGANYAGELKPVVRRQQFEVAAVPRDNPDMVNTNVARISTSLTKNKKLSDEDIAYIKMLEKKVAENTEEKKKENKEPTAFENAVDSVANEFNRGILDTIVGALLGNN